jgi:hypothetical protein
MTKRELLEAVAALGVSVADSDLWSWRRTGNRLVMRTEAQAQNEHGEMICVPLRDVLTFDRPEPVMDRDN